MLSDTLSEFVDSQQKILDFLESQLHHYFTEHDSTYDYQQEVKDTVRAQKAKIEEATALLDDIRLRLDIGDL